MYKKNWICIKCGYDTNKKQNYEKHISRPTACEKRIKRHDKMHNVVPCSPICSPNVVPNVVSCSPNVVPCSPNVVPNNKLQHNSENNIHSLQCQTCLKVFSCRQNKYRHIKAGKCVSIKDKDKQIEELKQQLEEEKQKRKEDGGSKSTINNYNITNNNNYFDHSINYNNYDNLSLDHITKEDIKRLFNNCRMQYPELSEDLTRMILSPKENQCIYLPEGQKSNTCAVIKDGVEMRKPLIRVLMDLGVQTATLIRDSNVIVRNKKDVVNNQFWADNRNACGLNISDIDYMTDTDKEIVQRNKNIVLDMSDGKI